MFDLPVVDPEDRRNASHFRQYLLKNGYSMLQYSIYDRIVTGIDMSKKYEESLKRNVPDKGSIRMLRITEKQFNNMDILVGYKSPNENKLSDNPLTKF
ncbi:CRISPR-associated endonuclease Cas2 [Apilactobacillus sp. TMW 2.2459]|nr:CRISPR-associated endonuclease Cas2 [Apilactobacillus xinyiensis]